MSIIEAQMLLPRTDPFIDKDGNNNNDNASLSSPGWEPRSSTPNGPRPLSPAKRQPSPLPLVADEDSVYQGRLAIEDLMPVQTTSESGIQSPAHKGGVEPVMAPARGGNTPPRPKPAQSAWRSMPGFEELDQSWAAESSRRSDGVDQAPAPSANQLSVPTAVLRDSTRRLVSNNNDAFFDARTSLLTASTGTSNAENNGPRKTWIEHKGGKKIASATHLRPHPRPNIPSLTSLTDSEAMLQPGPSSSVMRKRSQDVKKQVQALDDGSSSAPESGAASTLAATSARFDDILNTPREAGEVRDRRRTRSGSSASSSSSSSGSGRKQGSGEDQQAQTDGQQYSSAQDIDATDSVSDAAGVTASEGAEATFIHHSDASDLPPVLRPAWQKGVAGAADPRTPGKKGKGLSNIGGDMFTPLKLQTMFKTPTPPATTTQEPKGQLAVPTTTASQVFASTTVTPAQSPNPPSVNTSSLLTSDCKEPLASRSAVFTFRSPVVSAQNSPFAHLATPKSSARKRGLSAEAYAHIGRTPSGSSATSHLRKQRSLPLRLFRFGESSRIEEPALVDVKGDVTRALEDEAALDGLSEEEAIRRFRDRVNELNRAKRAEMEAAKKLSASPPQTASPERKRIRLASTDGLFTDGRVTEAALSSAAPPSLPLEVMDSESPRKLFRKYSAAEQVDREIEAERRADHRLRISHYSDDERKREEEVAALEERIRARRERRAGGGRDAGTATAEIAGKKAPDAVTPKPPKIALVDEFGNNETIPQGMSRTYSATLIQSGRPALSRTQSAENATESVRSEEPIRRHASVGSVQARLNGASAVLAKSRGRQEARGMIRDQKPADPKKSLPPISTHLPRKRVVEPIPEVSDETLPSPLGPSPESDSQVSPAQATPTPPRTTHPRVSAGTPPILRPTYAMSQSPNVVPSRGSGLRHEVVPSEDGDTTRSDATQLTHGSQIEQDHEADEALSRTHYGQPAPAVLVRDTARMQSSVAATPLKGAGGNVYSNSSTPQPPRSILKGAASADVTPISSRIVQAPRSISFADGKTTGKMFSASPLKGIDDSWEDKDATPRAQHLRSLKKSQALLPLPKNSGIPKGKAARMEELLKQIAALALEADGVEDIEAEVPAAARTQHAEGADESEDSWQAPSPTSRFSERHSRNNSPFSTSAFRKSLASSRGDGLLAGRSVWDFDESAGDKTFLTQASFDVAHDRMVEVITDVAPWVPDWDELKSIDLRGRKLESVIRLKEFLPKLEEVALDENEISYFTGLPSTLKTLTVSFNQVPSIASYGHLLRLEKLDISHNEVDDLSSLECLQHLQYLRADYNGIKTLDGILTLEHLHSVSLRGNKLTVVNLQTSSWRKLSTLDVSHNRLITIRGLSTCRHLKSLNLTSNDLAHVELSPSMPKLRVLRVSCNPRLTELDVLPAKDLRTLYADFCALDRIQHLGSLNKLENLSVRQQQFSEEGSGFLWPASEIKDTKRLFLSGNACSRGLKLYASTRVPSPPRFTQLVYLELSACQLETLPSNFSGLFPTLHHLNLDHNLFSKLPKSSFSGLSGLKRLSMVGCRVTKIRNFLEALEGCEELSVLDTRMNPATLGLYPPLLLTTALTDPGLDQSGVKGNREHIISPAHLAPIPNLQIVRPDTALRQGRLIKEKIEEEEKQVWEKSFFHKRHPHPPTANDLTGDEDDETVRPASSHSGQGGAKASAATSTSTSTSASTSTSTYALSDARFVRTLPETFSKKRLLHRGTLGMVCPRLEWLDGLELSDEEVLRAEKLLVEWTC